MPQTTVELEPDSAPDAGPKAKVRLLSLDDLDRRTRAAQQALQLRDSLTTSLGGADYLSPQEAELVDAAALMSAMLKSIGSSYLAGGRIDVGEFLAICNAQRRHLEALGLRTRPRDVTPKLDEYLSSRERS